METLVQLTEKALEVRAANIKEKNICEGVGIYVSTTHAINPVSLCEQAIGGDVDSARVLAELAYQADDVPLLRAVYRLGTPGVLRDVHIWAAFAYGAVACAVWYARTLRITKKMLLDDRCDLDYSSLSCRNSALLVVLSAYGRVRASALMDMCVHHQWSGWVHVVSTLGASMHPRHLYMLPDTTPRLTLRDFLSQGLYAALEQKGTAHDWQTLASLLNK